MITCRKCDIGKRDLVTFFYDKEDDNFFRNIHKSGGTKDECIEDTCNSIEESSVLFEIFDGANRAAFFSRFEFHNVVVLESFHVMKQYRNKEFLTVFCDTIKKECGKWFYAGIWEGNFPALRFLQKMGMTVEKSLLNKGQYFIIFKIR